MHSLSSDLLTDQCSAVVGVPGCLRCGREAPGDDTVLLLAELGVRGGNGRASAAERHCWPLILLVERKWLRSW